MGAAASFFERFAKWFCVTFVALTVFAFLSLSLIQWGMSLDRQNRLEREKAVHSIEPPGKGLNHRDPKAVQELRERGFELPQ